MINYHCKLTPLCKSIECGQPFCTIIVVPYSPFSIPFCITESEMILAYVLIRKPESLLALFSFPSPILPCSPAPVKGFRSLRDGNAAHDRFIGEQGLLRIGKRDTTSLHVRLCRLRCWMLSSPLYPFKPSYGLVHGVRSRCIR